jgi:hypothetical protein
MAQRSEVVSVRLLPDERAVVSAITDLERFANPSEAVRYCLRETARALGLWPPPSDGQSGREQKEEVQ